MGQTALQSTREAVVSLMCKVACSQLGRVGPSQITLTDSALVDSSQ